MSGYQAPTRDIGFSLFEVLDYEAHCASLPLVDTLDRETAETLLAEYARFCEEQIASLSRSGDEAGCQFQDGDVVTPAGFVRAYQQYAASGWFSLACDPRLGGQGLPGSFAKVLVEIMVAANPGFSLYTSAIPGAIATLSHYGSESQRHRYEPRLISGEWNATMCLTEPHCGTDLGLLRTRAVPNADDSYSISGTKIFITGGDHDLTENIIHLVLARIDGAPAGTQGISLFIVPKCLTDEPGVEPGRNAVHCGAIEKKMGVKASATCVMNFDAATGFLLGEPGRGLAAMFTFINASRISAAAQGVSHAEFGFQQALAYARERLQMRSLSGVKNPTGPADPIIVHPDVRRMLLTQKAFAEGNRLFNHYLGLQLDVAKSANHGEARAMAEQRLALLTPVAKAFITETGVESADLAIQCFGGHGYIREWGVEQNLRDARIATLYEGTTGIQAIDLLARKVLVDGGSALALFQSEIRDFVATLDVADVQLQRFASALTAKLSEWEALTVGLAARAEADADEIGAASVSYLMFCGYVVLAYFWARAAALAATRVAAGTDIDGFYAAKVQTAEFYFDHVLPRTLGLQASVTAGARSMMALEAAAFRY